MGREPSGSVGSSPRMRGALYCAPTSRPSGRIIPAYAGSTFSGLTTVLHQGDHPRVCGEHEPRSVITIMSIGSSPRMRGAQRIQARPGPVVGIIPAYAGSTPSDMSRIVLTGDHPRVCGEHNKNRFYKLVTAGSSPRMRGALFIITDKGGIEGIIPAYAGSTVQWSEGEIA